MSGMIEIVVAVVIIGLIIVPLAAITFYTPIIIPAYLLVFVSIAITLRIILFIIHRK